jgi:hypothetical protein
VAEPKVQDIKRKVGADRQRIVEVFPSTHRGAFVARERQRIVEISGGAGTVLHRSLPL